MRIGLLSCAIVLISALAAAPASAKTAYWHLSSGTAPTNLTPGGKGKVIATVVNLGDEVTSGTITVVDKLPEGLTATTAVGQLANETGELFECAVMTAREVVCHDSAFRLDPSTGLKITVNVDVGQEVLGNNRVEASGGKAEPAALERPVRLNAATAPYEVERYEFKPEEELGSADQQAGSHPFQLTTAFGLSQTGKQEPVALTKELQFSLPPGLIGNPQSTPRCSEADFSSYVGVKNLCPTDTVVGVAEVTIEEPKNFNTGPEARTVPVFNLEPAEGEPARFGLEVLKDPVVLETSVRTGSDYGVTVIAKSSSQTAGLISSVVSIWGVPGDPRHNAARGWKCVEALESLECKKQQEEEEEAQKAAKEKGEEPKPFLVLPTTCATPLKSPMRARSWVPGAPLLPPVESEFEESFSGCLSLPFAPLLAGRETEPGVRQPGVEPYTEAGGKPAKLEAGSTPAGLTVRVTVPQPETDTGLAESATKETTVALPEGVQLNPGAANGLEACTALQMGFLGASEPTQTLNNQFSPEESLCEGQAKGSKVGTISIVSPDLEEPLTGFVYLASEGTNPFEPPLVLYVDAFNKKSGVRVKLAGKVTPNPVTGQLVSTFENTPPVPFSELIFSFFSGGRASISTPPLCGGYTTTSSFVPWSGNAPATPSATFPITSSCSASNPQPFAPGFSAGANNLQAGGFTSFALTLGIPDGSQALTGLSTHLPPGMAAMLSSVTPCPIAQADAAQCGPESLVGHSTSITGLGSQPFTLPGSVYLTGPYDGAPFGLSVATPAVAGPFNLGNVIANSTIEVDPNTAAVTVTARETRILDPRGATTVASSPLPTIIKGVPVALKAINVTVDRPNFQFNPTNCGPLAITGALAGSQGALVPISTHYQVANCENLPFGPKLTAATNGTASKVNGTNLNVTVTSAGLGQANIAKVFLQLPAALPSRLTTIQKACPDTVFNANPATCDEGSLIGHATIHTPVLKGPLTGPAYLVSHGNAAFPDVEFVLQGEGILLVLDGKTDIKKGITYSRFEAAPDAPFTTFETTLPAGPHSALTAYTPATPYNVCKTNLEMPTEITGQNGAVIKRITKIAVQNCGAVLSSKETALQKALKACKKKYAKNKKKRQKCEAAARKKYAPKKKKAAKKKK